MNRLHISPIILHKLCWNSTASNNIQNLCLKLYVIIIRETPSYEKNLNLQNMKRVLFTEAKIL